jgi:hypothetical protein
MSETDKTSASPDAGYSSHNEQEKIAQNPEPKLVDAPARRQSVALNIVENPLKVSFACNGNLDKISDTDSLHSHSAAPKSRPPPMPEALPRRTVWLSTLLYLDGPLSSRATMKDSRC